jgi:hypothetical protein
MTDDDHNYLAAAAECWSNGKIVDAGRLIFEHLPIRLRPVWAADLLRLILKQTRIECDQIEAILTVTEDQTRWKESYAIFMLLRDCTLDLIKHNSLPPSESLILAVVGLAEDVAKVTYNASDPPDRFDDDAGWYIVPAVKHICDLVGVEAFSRVIREVLFSGKSGTE